MTRLYHRQPRIRFRPDCFGQLLSDARRGDGSGARVSAGRRSRAGNASGDGIELWLLAATLQRRSEHCGQDDQTERTAYTVVGVTAREFIGTESDVTQFWIPLMMRDQVHQAGGWLHKRWLTDRDADAFALTGRLKPGVLAPAGAGRNERHRRTTCAGLPGGAQPQNQDQPFRRSDLC